MAYNPSQHSLSSKSMGMSQASPTDARSMFYDTVNFIYRPYQSTSEVFSYLNLSKYRSGNVSVFINIGGTLNGDGTFTGGVVDEYWFKDGTSTSDLVVKTSGVAGVASFNGRTGAVLPQAGDYTQSDVGLGNVDNTSDASKPVSTAQSSALAAKAPLASPTFTGTPTAPTAALGTNTTQIATTAFVLANGGGGGGAVSSVFGRTGAVTAQSGDYTLAQMTGDSTHRTVTDAQISSWNAGSTGVFSDPGARLFDVRDYGLIINDSTEEANNTTKMNTLVADLVTANGGVIFFPEAGLYYCTVSIPVNPNISGNFAPKPVTIRGGVAPFNIQGSQTAGFTRTTDDWTIIRSTGALPAVTIGAPQSNWMVTVENIECQTTGSAIYCLDLRGANQSIIRSVSVTDGTWGHPGSYPYSNTGIIQAPEGNGGNNYLDNVSVAGFNTGFNLGEHAVATHIQAYFCNWGIYSPGNYHSNIIMRYQTCGNTYDLYVDDNGARHQFEILQHDVEVAGATRAHVYDPGGWLYGTLKWTSTKGGCCNFVTFVVNSLSSKFHAAEIGRLFKDFDRGPLLLGADRYYPNSNEDAWGQTYEKDAWYSIFLTTTLSATYGLGGATTETLAAGADGWIAQKYVAPINSAFIGLKTSGGSTIGFSVNADDVGIIYYKPGDGGNYSTGVSAIAGAFYRLNRASGVYTIDVSTNDGASWTTVYTYSSPFGGTTPAGAYSAYMEHGLGGTGGIANYRNVGPIYYPQGSL
jgi:hypothetical protein